MTDQPDDKLTPPAKPPLVWPPNCHEVPGVPMAFVGAEHLRPLKAEAPAPEPGTVTGSTGAEVIALGTVIGIVGAQHLRPLKDEAPPPSPVPPPMTCAPNCIDRTAGLALSW